MKKLRSLTQFLRENLPEEAFRGAEFTSEADEIQFIKAHKDMGNQQYQMLIMQTEAIIAWGNFPHEKIDPAYIPLLIEAWESKQDDEFYDSNIDAEVPSMTVELNGNTAVIIIGITLSEPVFIKQDAKGIIPFEEKRWAITEPHFCYAPLSSWAKVNDYAD